MVFLRFPSRSDRAKRSCCSATGDRAGRCKAEGWRVPDPAVTAPPAQGRGRGTGPPQPLEVLQASDLSAKVLLPAEWKPGLFAVRLSNRRRHVRHDLPEPHETLVVARRRKPEAAYAGETIRVFGNNFGEQTRAWLVAGGGPSVELPVVKAEKYAAEFTVPADARRPATTRYGSTTATAARRVSADRWPSAWREREPWPATQFNVRDFGARGNSTGMRGENVPDDTPAFEAALAKAAANGGGVVFVPRGTYKITGKLVIPAKTVLRGERREWVWLYAPKDLPEFDTVLAGNGDFAVEELSIVSQTARRLIVCPDVPSIYSRGAGHVPADKFGHNARSAAADAAARALLASGPVPRRRSDPRRRLEGMTTIVLAGPDMEISDCEVVSAGGPFALFGGHRCADLRQPVLANGRCGAYLSWDAEEMLFRKQHVRVARQRRDRRRLPRPRLPRVRGRQHVPPHVRAGPRGPVVRFAVLRRGWAGRCNVDGARLTAREYSRRGEDLDARRAVQGPGVLTSRWARAWDNTFRSSTTRRRPSRWRSPFAVPPDETSHLAFITTKTDTVVTGQHVLRRQRGRATVLPMLRGDRRRQPLGADRRDVRLRRRQRLEPAERSSTASRSAASTSSWTTISPKASSTSKGMSMGGVVGPVHRRHRERSRPASSASATSCATTRPATTTCSARWPAGRIRSSSIRRLPRHRLRVPRYAHRGQHHHATRRWRWTCIRSISTRCCGTTASSGRCGRSRDDGIHTWIRPARTARLPGARASSGCWANRRI